MHSSHITQPLDVGIFRPMKQAWKKAVVNYAVDHTGKSVSDIGHLLEYLRNLLFKVPTVVNLFRATGTCIYPVDFTE